MRREANLPPIIVQVGKGHFQIVIGEQARDVAGPLDHDDVFPCKQAEQAHVPHLRGRVAQPIAVGMPKHEAIGPDIAIDEDEGRAGDRRADAQSLREPGEVVLPAPRSPANAMIAAGEIAQEARELCAERRSLRGAMGF